MIIVWMSQHSPLPSQKAALQSLFPSHTLLVEARPFDGIDDIIDRFHLANGDEMVVVAPLTVVRELVRRGIHPIYAEMKKVACKGIHEVKIGKRCFQFIRFQRVRDVKLELEDITPAPATAAKVSATSA